MPVPGIDKNDITNILNATSVKRDGVNKELDKDAFLQLLVTQMRYQDPLEPTDNAEYIAQLAQFSALEQMTNVADGLSKVMTLVDNIDTSLLVGQLTSMIGKGVQWMQEVKAGEGETEMVKREGVIKAVSITDGAPSVIAVDQFGNQHRVEIGDLTRIGSLV